LNYEKRLGIEKKKEEDTSEEKDTESKKLENEPNNAMDAYKRMKSGMTHALISGEINKYPDNLKTKTSNLLTHGPPSSAISSAIHWKRLDPSETIVLSQATILKINDLIQHEMQKKLNPNSSSDSTSQSSRNSKNEIEEMKIDNVNSDAEKPA